MTEIYMYILNIQEEVCVSSLAQVKSIPADVTMANIINSNLNIGNSGILKRHSVELLPHR